MLISLFLFPWEIASSCNNPAGHWAQGRDGRAALTNQNKAEDFSCYYFVKFYITNHQHSRTCLYCATTISFHSSGSVNGKAGGEEGGFFPERGLHTSRGCDMQAVPHLQQQPRWYKVPQVSLVGPRKDSTSAKGGWHKQTPSHCLRKTPLTILLKLTSPGTAWEQTLLDAMGDASSESLKMWSEKSYITQDMWNLCSEMVMMDMLLFTDLLTMDN